MDLFEKCRDFYSNPESAPKYGYPMTPRAAMAAGLFPFFIPIDQAEGPEAIIDGSRKQPARRSSSTAPASPARAC